MCAEKSSVRMDLHSDVREGLLENGMICWKEDTQIEDMGRIWEEYTDRGEVGRDRGTKARNARNALD